LLPGHRREGCELRDRELHPGDRAADGDDAAERDRRHGAREDADLARRDQQRPARRARRRDGEVGDPREPRRAEGDRSADVDQGHDGEADACRPREARGDPPGGRAEAGGDPHGRGREAGRGAARAGQPRSDDPRGGRPGEGDRHGLRGDPRRQPGSAAARVPVRAGTPADRARPVEQGLDHPGGVPARARPDRLAGRQGRVVAAGDLVPPVVREKALAVGAGAWVDELPLLVASIEADWRIAVGRAYRDSTEAFVAEATCDDGTAAVLKLIVPRDGDAAAHEITALRLAAGDGCPLLLRNDVDRGALLVERLGRSLCELQLPLARRHEILVSAAMRIWRPAPDSGLPTGAAKATWLHEFITAMWEELDRPCSERAVEH